MIKVNIKQIDTTFHCYAYMQLMGQLCLVEYNYTLTNTFKGMIEDVEVLKVSLQGIELDLNGIYFAGGVELYTEIENKILKGELE